jgi:integrase
LLLIDPTRTACADDYRRVLRVHVRPHFGPHAKVADVTFADVDRLHRKITALGYARRANSVVAIVSKMFSLAVRWGMRDTNPCKGVERNYEVERKRYLFGEELAQLMVALAAHPDKPSADAFRLLLLTGQRRGEVLAMRWADVDLTTGTWTKPGTTTKQKADHVVPLSAPARQLLSELQDAHRRAHPKKPLPEFVFPGRGASGHVTNVKRNWRALTKAAGVTDLRIHDLRHSFASQLVSGGASLPLIGALLGHSSPTITARYAHMFADPQRAAVERVASIIENAGKPAPDTLVPLGKGRGRP